VTELSPETYVERIDDERRRAEAGDLLALMKEITGEEAVMSGADTIGYGTYHYRYKTGQEGDFFKVGFSPRKDQVTLYVMSGLVGFDDILARLGPHTAGKSTVHLKRLADVDRPALVDLIRECVAHLDRVERELGAIPRMKDLPPRVP
jgi:hypothetical protein